MWWADLTSGHGYGLAGADLVSGEVGQQGDVWAVARHWEHRVEDD